MGQLRKYFSLLTTCLVVTSIFISTSVQAIPITLDFNSGIYSAQSSNGLINQYAEDGFIVRTLSPLDDFYSASGSYGGSLSWFKDEDITGTTNNIIKIATADGGLFDLLSTDIIAAFSGITFTGSNGATVTGGGSNNTRTFGSEWMNLSSFTMSIPLDSRILTIVDNIVLNTHVATVPEPATWLLILLGLISIILLRQRGIRPADLVVERNNRQGLPLICG